MVTSYPRIHKLNWNLLRTFLVIVEEKSITKAAHRLLVRQPSVTSALQKLEETLGSQLIQRDSRRFLLTSHGEMLRQECMEIMRRVERIGEKLSSDDDELAGQIRILSVTHLPLPELDEALRQMRRRHRSVSVRIDVAHSQDIVRTVAQKQAPFGLCLLPKPLATLNCHFVFREEFGIYCGRTHPMFGRTDITLDELRQEAFIAFTCSQDGGALEPMISLRDGAGLGAWTAGSSPHLEEVRRLIVAGLGIGILPIEGARSLTGEELWHIPTSLESLGADVYFITNPEADLNPAERSFLQMFSSALFDARAS